MSSYRQAIDTIELSIEKLTPTVPDDGFFYVVLAGSVKGRFRTLAKAQLLYKELLRASGWKPPAQNKARPDPSVEAVERYMDELTDYWSSSHAHRKPGAGRA